MGIQQMLIGGGGANLGTIYYSVKGNRPAPFTVGNGTATLTFSSDGAIGTTAASNGSCYIVVDLGPRSFPTGSPYVKFVLATGTNSGTITTAWHNTSTAGTIIAHSEGNFSNDISGTVSFSTAGSDGTITNTITLNTLSAEGEDSIA
jgi:hypothetical protein